MDPTSAPSSGAQSQPAPWLALISAAALISLWPAVSFVMRPRAASTTAPGSIVGYIPRECSVTATNLDFGSYDPIVANKTSDKTGTATITLTCTKSYFNTVKIGIDNGANVNQAVGATRGMKLQSATVGYLGYFLYTNAGMTTQWLTGDGALSVGPAPSTAPRAFTIYGRIPAGRDVRPGGYLDTATITVTY